jgi:hypothetical protein
MIYSGLRGPLLIAAAILHLVASAAVAQNDIRTGRVRFERGATT